MKSIQTKLTLATVCIVTILMIASTAFGVIAIRNVGNNSSEQLLVNLCESGAKNLDSYFNSVEQSVKEIPRN